MGKFRKAGVQIHSKSQALMAARSCNSFFLHFLLRKQVYVNEQKKMYRLIENFKTLRTQTKYNNNTCHFDQQQTMYLHIYTYIYITVSLLQKKTHVTLPQSIKQESNSQPVRFKSMKKYKPFLSLSNKIQILSS